MRSSKYGRDNNIQEESTSQLTESTWFRLLLLTVFASGIFFRLSGLKNKIYSHDEAYTSLHAAGYHGGEAFNGLWDGEIKKVEDLQYFLIPNQEREATDTFLILALYEPHETPLFFLLEHYWMRKIGFTPASMRGLAALFGLLSIPAMYWLSKEMFQSSLIALLSTTLFIISPYHILMAQDARPYSLLALITMISTAALLRSMRKNILKNWIIYSLTLVIGAYSHLLFIFVAVGHGIFFISIYLTDRKIGFGHFLGASLFASLAFSPWIYMLISRWERAASNLEWVNYQIPWYRYIQRWILLFGSPFIDFDFNSELANLLPYILRALILILLSYSLLFFMKHGSKWGKWLILSIYSVTIGTLIGLDLFLGGIRSTAGRYFVPANIVSILVLAWFLANRLNCSDQTLQVNWRRIFNILILVSFLSNINILLAETWWNKELGRIRAEFIRVIDRDQALLIVSGSHPTNLGDVLLLGFELNQDVEIKLYRDSNDINYTGNYKNIYWFPSSYRDVQKISAKDSFKVKDTLDGVLWTILDGED